jgi:tetrahydromethanopterin S-methyltransferase subunit G
MQQWTSLAKRELSKLTFIALWVLGFVQSFLLGSGVGRSSGIRYGLGIPLVIALVLAGAMWALFARQVRRDALSLREGVSEH